MSCESVAIVVTPLKRLVVDSDCSFLDHMAGVGGMNYLLVIV